MGIPHISLATVMIDVKHLWQHANPLRFNALIASERNAIMGKTAQAVGIQGG
jgi:hypothetical protein